MGANQSNPTGKTPRAHEQQEVKTSYYELLGVEKQATDDEIKKAYRRKALELHPDRNYGDVERATALFAEIQSAYEVLADPQERAWYDTHEDAILRDVDLDAGDSPETYERNIGLTTADDISRMLRKFHGGVEFSDAPSGFFGYLRETFETLAREEELAAKRDGLEVVDYPSFGHKDDGHEDVVKVFYASWNGFATKKNFSWRDKYRTSDAPDRRTRRYIEKENKQFRDDAIREFNDAVRTLVAFVRKRDPRYTPNTQSELEREKALREAATARAAKMRAENAAKMDKEVLPEWAKFREPDEVEDMEDEESEEEQFECVACRKTFKSENQFEAHERSKKHVKAVQALKRKMQKEGIALDIDSEDDEGVSGAVTPVAVEDYELVEKPVESEHHGEVDDEDDGPLPPGTGKSPESTNLETAFENLDINTPNSPSDSDDSSTSSTTRTRKHPTAPPRNPSSPSPSSPSQAEMEQTQPKLGKAAQKRAKKAAQSAQEAHDNDDSQHKCATCNAPFPSKTRLFQHIKDHGHAAPVGAVKGKGGGKGKKR